MKIYCKVTERGLVPMYGSDMDIMRPIGRGDDSASGTRRC